LPKESVLFFGVVLIIVGALFLGVNKRNKPKMPPKARELLKELNRR
jgi:hypothetical protein